MPRVFVTRQGSRVGSMTRRKPMRLVSVILACGHSVWFNVKIRPSKGEIVCCTKCDGYEKVVE